MMTLKIESGDCMDNLMTLIMSMVRKMTGSDQKMGVIDAQQALEQSLLRTFYRNRIDLSNTSKYDPNTWYPVNSNNEHSNELDIIKVQRSLDGAGGAPWGTHVTSNGHGFTVAKEIMMNHNGWGSMDVNAYLLQNSHKFDDGKYPVVFDQVPHNGGYVIWLRGGAFYDVDFSISNTTWTINTEPLKDNPQFAPTKTQPTELQYLSATISGDGAVNYLDLTTLAKKLKDIKNKLGGVIRLPLIAHTERRCVA